MSSFWCCGSFWGPLRAFWAPGGGWCPGPRPADRRAAGGRRCRSGACRGCGPRPGSVDGLALVGRPRPAGAGRRPAVAGGVVLVDVGLVLVVWWWGRVVVVAGPPPLVWFGLVRVANGGGSAVRSARRRPARRGLGAGAGRVVRRRRGPRRSWMSPAWWSCSVLLAGSSSAWCWSGGVVLGLDVGQLVPAWWSSAPVSSLWRPETGLVVGGGAPAVGGVWAGQGVGWSSTGGGWWWVGRGLGGCWWWGDGVVLE